jgi:cysteinyl-tRNA synthetase
MEFADKEVADAEKAVERLDALVRRARTEQLPVADPVSLDPFREAMDNDFDTPAAVAFLFDLVRRANTALDEGRAEEGASLVAAVRKICDILGIDLHDDTPELDDEIRAMVEARDAARARKDFAASDRIRDELRGRGVVLEDTPNGTAWRRVRPDEEV